MKSKVCTTVCAVLTLMLCIILGALFGTAAPGAKAVETACSTEVQQAVADCGK